MKVLCIYDSIFGNTEKIAQAIAKGIGADCQCLRAGDVALAQIAEADLIIIGSPTRGFKATPALMNLLNSIPINMLEGKKVAAFDTRMLLTNVKGKLFRKLIDMGGYAAPIIAKQLQSKGGELIKTAEGFYVSGEQGPLVEGELERAGEWGKQLK